MPTNQNTLEVTAKPAAAVANIILRLSENVSGAITNMSVSIAASVLVSAAISLALITFSTILAEPFFRAEMGAVTRETKSQNKASMIANMMTPNNTRIG